MYELFYGLNRRPFRMSPDLESFCLSQSHKRAMAHLHYGLQQTEGFVVLTGLAGSGKTLLLSILIEELKKQNVCVAHVRDAMSDDNELLPSILAAFNKPIFEYQLRALISQLEAYLLSKAEAGQRSIVVIDEAQNLTQRNLQILRLLTNLQYKNQAVLQVILVGDSSLDEIISDPKNHLLRQRIVMSYQMSPMVVEDTKKYIHHRLSCAGWKSDPEIQEDVYVIIHQLSNGFPGEINRLCDRLLMQGMLQQKHSIAGADVENLLSDDNNYQVTPAIELQKADDNVVINSVLEAMVIETPAIENISTDLISEVESLVSHQEKVVPEIEDILFNEVEEKIKTKDVNQDGGFKADKNELMPGALILLVSYAASILLAIGLFYYTNTQHKDELPQFDDSNSIQAIDREKTSFACID